MGTATRLLEKVVFTVHVSARKHRRKICRQTGRAGARLQVVCNLLVSAFSVQGFKYNRLLIRILYCCLCFGVPHNRGRSLCVTTCGFCTNSLCALRQIFLFVTTSVLDSRTTHAKFPKKINYVHHLSPGQSPSSYVHHLHF